MSNVVLFRMREANALVGVVEDRTGDGGWLLSAVAVVRYWGTTAGFPELTGGPTDKTKLDKAEKMPPGTLAEIPRDAVLYAIPADQKAWAGVFSGSFDEAATKKRR